MEVGQALGGFDYSTSRREHKRLPKKMQIDEELARVSQIEEMFRRKQKPDSKHSPRMLGHLQELNGYSYIFINLINFVDPSGLHFGSSSSNGNEWRT